MKKSFISILTALSLTASVFGSMPPVSANASDYTESGILEEVEFAATENYSNYYYVKSMTDSFYYLYHFGHKPSDNCIVYINDVKEFLRDGNELPKVGDLIHISGVYPPRSDFWQLDLYDTVPENEDRTVTNYGSAADIFGVETLDEMLLMTEMYYTEWRTRLNPEEMLDTDGNRYVFTDKDELLADISEKRNHYFCLLDAGKNLVVSINPNDRQINDIDIAYALISKVDFGSEELGNGDLLYLDYYEILETYPPQIPARNVVNYGNAAAILGTEKISEINEYFSSDQYNWIFDTAQTKSDHSLSAESDSEEIWEKVNDRSYDYMYVIRQDENGFLMNRFVRPDAEALDDIVPNDDYSAVYLPKELYDRIKTDGMKEFEVGDIVRISGLSLWAWTYPQTLHGSGNPTLENYGSAYDLIGDIEDMHSRISADYSDFLARRAAAPDTVSTSRELADLVFAGTPKQNAYYEQRVYYVNARENGKYYCSSIAYDDSKGYGFCEDSNIIYENDIQLIPEEYRDSFEVGDVIFVKWNEYGSAMRLDCYSTIKKLCTFSNIGTDDINIKLPEITLPESIIASSANYADINLDGRTSVADIVVLQGYLLGKVSLSREQAENADINKDGKVNVFDMTQLKKLLLNSVYVPDCAEETEIS